jgi:GDPmannose 4,6-dehydratase
LGRGFRFIDTSRDPQVCSKSRLERFGILHEPKLLSLAPNDFRSVLKTLTAIEPDQVSDLGWQTSVGLSFEQSLECMESIAVGMLNFLEALRYLAIGSRFFIAGSSKYFSDTGDILAAESLAFNLRRTYAVAKSTAF